MDKRTIISGNLDFTTEVSPTCNNSYFTCGNDAEHCIPWLWVCDGDFDCHDDSDESYDLCKFSGTCGGNFTIPHGILTSPSYPDTYPNKMNCVYAITQPTGTAILLNVITINTERLLDILEIRDGPSEASPRLAEISGINNRGSGIPTTIRSSQNQLWIK